MKVWTKVTAIVNEVDPETADLKKSESGRDVEPSIEGSGKHTAYKIQGDM